MPADPGLLIHWPFVGLRIRTPVVDLRYLDDELLDAIAALAAAGIHPPDAMPFTMPWTRQPAEVLRREYGRWAWRARSELSPAGWSLPFAVVVDGEVCGVQDVFAKEFAVSRTADTGSWLGMRFHGRGIGTEMRHAVLHLVFAGLGAELARSGAFADNGASIAVSRKVGYEDDGWSFEAREGAQARIHRFRLTRDAWLARRRDDITVDGLEPCLGLLGL